MRKTLLGTIAGFVAGVMVAMAMPGFAADTQDPEPVAEEKPITLVVNGQEITLPDAQPRIVDGQVMVPVVPFSMVAGFNVTWDEAARAVKVTTRAASKVGTIKDEASIPLSVDVDGVTYYSAWPVARLVESRHPGKRVSLSDKGLRLDGTLYQVAFHVVNDPNLPTTYLDVRPLIEAKVIEQKDLLRLGEFRED